MLIYMRYIGINGLIWLFIVFENFMCVDPQNLFKNPKHKQKQKRL